MKKNIIIGIIIAVICGIIFMYQTQKVGFHEDEGYTIASSVNPYNGLMSAYKNNDVPENENPVWKTKEYVTNYVTLTPNNYLNLASIYMNQAYDNHPPFFYLLVHFSSMLFLGKFSVYTAFIVNIIAFAISCIVLKKTLKLIGKEHLTIATLIFYGLSMGTISMVIYQRMYMLLNLFVMLYFYYSLKIYKNDFVLDKKTTLQLAVVTILGFLTQYFFAVYAAIVFFMMLIKMKKSNNQDKIKKYFVIHIIYAVIGILAFVPSMYHLFFSGRGITNLSSGNYFEYFGKFINQLAYAFSINTNLIVVLITLALFFAGIIYLYKKSEDKFITLLTIIPSIIYFILMVKLTPFQELRYIMVVIPFIVLTVFLILDCLIKTKYKNQIIIEISVILVAIGMTFSTPKFLYRNYKEILNIAKENSEKPFVYVYDNFFNHMQSIPEMMIYEKTLIIDTGKNEMDYLVKDEELQKEDSFILSIKSYMNNEEIINKIKNETDFKNIKKLYSSKEDTSNESKVQNELYLVTKTI